MKENYQLLLDGTIEELSISGIKPRLLLQCCCAPCSSYVLEYLNKYFEITAFYYNPNISPQSEFMYRAEELKRFVSEFPLETPVSVIIADYEHEKFLSMSRGKEDLPEGGARCYECYNLRLEETARLALAEGFDYFTTTLSISPYKNAVWLNEIAKALSEKYGIKYLFSDFKKKNGYKRSCELSKEYELYRQPFCGCEFSRREAENRKE